MGSLDSCYYKAADYLIPSITRRNTLSIISAPSKSKKSFLVSELALSIATGTDFLGHKVTKGKVMYIDPELRKPTLFARIIGLANQIPNVSFNDVANNIDFLTLRGTDKTDFFKKLDVYLKNKQQQGIKYDAVIIDSIYTFMAGDENSNTEMSKLMDQLISITDKYAAVFTTMHVSKSTAAGKSGYEAVDRSAGSGVAGRAGDAIWAISKCDSNKNCNEYYKIDIVLREDKSPDPLYIEIDESGIMPVHKIVNNASALGLTVHNAKNASKNETKAARNKQIQDLYYQCISTNGVFHRDDIQNIFCVNQATARSYAAEAGFTCINGVLSPKSNTFTAN